MWSLHRDFNNDTNSQNISFILEDSFDTEENDGYASANGEESEYDTEFGEEADNDQEGPAIEEVIEDEICEVSETFEATQARIVEENEASQRTERRAAREKEKARRAEEPRRSMGFHENDDTEHDITFNAGSDNPATPTTPRSSGPKKSQVPKRILKRKDRGSVGGAPASADTSQKVLKTSEFFPSSDWPLGMTEAQVSPEMLLYRGLM